MRHTCITEKITILTLSGMRGVSQLDFLTYFCALPENTEQLIDKDE